MKEGRGGLCRCVPLAVSGQEGTFSQSLSRCLILSSLSLSPLRLLPRVSQKGVRRGEKEVDDDSVEEEEEEEEEKRGIVTGLRYVALLPV